MLTSQELSTEERAHIQRWLNGWQVPDLSTPTEYQRHLQAEGFQQVTYEDITDHVVKTARHLYQASYLTPPFAQLMSACGLRTEKQKENRLAARVQY